MRTFDHFPKDSICKICGKNDDKECMLAPIDGTDNGNICQAIPIHVDCLSRIRYNKKIDVFYIRGIEEVKNMSPQRDKKGPPKNSGGPRDGHGKGKGRNTNSPGVGKQKGGKKGFQK